MTFIESLMLAVSFRGISRIASILLSFCDDRDLHMFVFK